MRSPAEPTTSLTLTLLYTLLLLWGHVVRQVDAAFQLPPFLRSLSEQTLNKDQAEGFDSPVYTLPTALPNVPNVQRYLPRKKNLKTHKLSRRLRKDWDPFWMSVERPADAGLELVKQAPVDPSLLLAVKRLNFTTVAGPDGARREAVEHEDAMRRLMSAWLMQRAACSVYFVWDDLGVRYWPRWVRRGSCQPLETRSPNSPTLFPSSSSSSTSSKPTLSQSCSWPPGMSCVPAESRRIRILRWTCRHNKAFKNWNPRFSSKGRRPRKPRKKKKNNNNNRGSGVSSNSFSDSRVKRDLSRLPALDTNTAEEEEKGLVVGEDEARRTVRAVVFGGVDEEDDINDTENWSRKPFKERRKKLSMRCKWKKIPYPVIDDCYCSC